MISSALGSGRPPPCRPPPRRRPASSRPSSAAGDDVGLRMVGRGRDRSRGRCRRRSARKSATRAALPVCCAHAQRQGLQALQQHPGIERRQRRAGVAEVVVQVLVDPVLVGQDDAAEAAALAVDVLGRRIDDDVGAEFQRLLLAAAWRRRCRRRASRRPHGRSRRRRRCRRLPASDWSGSPGRTPWCSAAPPFASWSRSRPSTSVRLDAVARQQRLDHVAAGAEQRPRGDDVVAGLDLAQQGGGDGGHAGRGGAGVLGAFQRAHPLLEHVRSSDWRSANR